MESPTDQLLTKYNDQLTTKIKQDSNTVHSTPTVVLNLLRLVDPTSKHIFQDWLVKRYLSNEINLDEDQQSLTLLLNKYRHYNKEHSYVPNIDWFKSIRQLHDFVFKKHAREHPVQQSQSTNWD